MSEEEQSVETVALAGAAAIQRLIAERNSYYNRMNAQQQELVAVDAMNKELRRRMALVRERYVETARRILAQLEQFEQTTRDAMGGTLPRDEAANVVGLAHIAKLKETQSRGNAEPAQ